MALLSPDTGAPKQSREAILRAFAALALEQRYGAIRIADVVARAGVGRATLYEHFHGKADILIATLEPLLVPLANAAIGRPADAHVRATLQHLWERRSPARMILCDAPFSKVQRRLAELIEERAEKTSGVRVPAMAALGAASAQLAMLRAWVGGTASLPIDGMLRLIVDCRHLVCSSGCQLPSHAPLMA